MPSTWTDSTAKLEDGRRLGYVAFGDPAGTPVFHFHGALTSRWEGFWLDPAARACGIRLISVDRPGVGNSDFVPVRRVVDWPRDVAQLADQLGLAQFSVVGVSGGGPYALACAHALPDRVKRVALIAGAAPLSDPAVFALMSLRQRTVLGSLIGRPKMLRAMVLAIRSLPQVLRVLAIGATLGGLSPADMRTIRAPELRTRMLALPPEAHSAPFGVDCHGPAWDGHLHSHAWGFDLASVRTPVELWYAEDDRIVPARMGRWLAGVLPNARGKFLADEGHLSLILGKAEDYLASFREAAAPVAASN